MKERHPTTSTSWQSSARWYDELVGEKGHYYHEHVILPRLFPLLDLTPQSSLLDLACGQGIVARKLPAGVSYTGLDAAKELIHAAKKYSPHTFLAADVTKSLPIKETFTHATCILALQNIEQPDKVFQNVKKHLVKGGRFVMVLNHPAFRIPRQSSWGFDDATKIQYRKINGYMKAQKVPISMHPGKAKMGEVSNTWSFHHPLSQYSAWLFQAGFVIEKIEEWCSDQVSVGGASRWENRAREEFPLFMTIVAKAV